MAHIEHFDGSARLLVAWHRRLCTAEVVKRSYMIGAQIQRSLEMDGGLGKAIKTKQR